MDISEEILRMRQAGRRGADTLGYFSGSRLLMN